MDTPITNPVSRRSALQLFGAAGLVGGLASLGLASTASATIVTHAVATGDVWLRQGPSTSTAKLAVIHKGAVVQLTGTARGIWYPVVFGDKQGWVSKNYLKLSGDSGQPVPNPMPAPAPKPGIITHPLFFTSVDQLMTAIAPIPVAKHFYGPGGVTANGKRIAETLHEEFPQIISMGGYRVEPGSDHQTGHAIDVMLPGNYTSDADKALGAMIAWFLQSNYKVFDVKYLIWQQHIWGEYRQQDGWRLMADRGSDTQNHKDHVHVSFY